MKRREVLATAAALSTGGLAGCIAGTGDGPTDEEPTDATTEPGDDAADGTTTGEDATGTPEDGTTTGDDSPEGTSGNGDSPEETTTGGDESGGTDGTETPDEADGTPTGDASTFDRSFEVTDAGCAGGTGDEADARFADGQVAVVGTIPGNNGCYAARLADAEYDDDADELVVTVESFVESEADTCTQCLVAIEYEASFAFEGGLPGAVVVRHREGDDVRTVTRASP